MWTSPKKAGTRSVRPKPQMHPKRAKDHAADREAALAFEKEQKRRERNNNGDRNLQPDGARQFHRLMAKVVGLAGSYPDLR